MEMRQCLISSNTATEGVLEIRLGGNINITEVKDNTNGVYPLILLETIDRKYQKLVINMSRVNYAHHGLVDVIRHVSADIGKEGKTLEVRNVYNQPQIIMEKLGIIYENQF